MPVDKQVIERYRVLNECFRNPYRDYTIEDLVDDPLDTLFSRNFIDVFVDRLFNGQAIGLTDLLVDITDCLADDDLQLTVLPL